MGAAGRAAVAAATGGLLSGAAAAWGLRGRDLSGDELNMLHLPPPALLAAAVDPSPPFWAHQPLSFLLRSLSLAALGEADPLAWRLHALAAAAGLGATVAGATAAGGGPRGLGAGVAVGLLCALHPVLRFYGQDAGNYALSALLASWLLLGAQRAAAGRGAGLLGAAVALALLNDLYALPWAAAASLAAVAGRGRAPWWPLVLGWAVGGLSLAPPALRLLADTGGQLALHADPPPPYSLPLPLEVGVRLGLRAAAALVGGLADGRGRAWADAGPLALLALGAAALAGRAGGHRGRLVLQISGMVLLAHLGAGIALQALGARVLPVEPRAHIALAPALLLGLGAALRRAPAVGALALALPLGITAGAAVLTPGDLRQTQRLALAALAAEAPAPLLLADPDAARWAAPPGAPPTAPCLPEPPPAAGALWAFDHEPAGALPPRCGAEPGWPTGWGLLALSSRPPPAQERSSSSFQPVRSAARIGPLPPAPGGAGWRVGVAPRPLTSLIPEDSVLVVEAEDGTPLARVPPAGGALPPGALPPGARVTLRLRAAEPGGALGPSLAQSDVLIAGLGGDWALWPDPLDLPLPRAALLAARALGGLTLLVLALRRPT